MNAHSFAMRRRIATSFSTPRSSKVCGVKANLRNVLLHIGHGAGPRVNSRSIHDSHLQSIRILDYMPMLTLGPTFYGNRHLLTDVV